jgi:hypothetical protein
MIICSIKRLKKKKKAFVFFLATDSKTCLLHHLWKRSLRIERAIGRITLPPITKLPAAHAGLF